MMTAHWTTITPSQYPWERAALDFVRALPAGIATAMASGPGG
jgi:hypothetical protein